MFISCRTNKLILKKVTVTFTSAVTKKGVAKLHVQQLSPWNKFILLWDNTDGQSQLCESCHVVSSTTQSQMLHPITDNGKQKSYHHLSLHTVSLLFRMHFLNLTILERGDYILTYGGKKRMGKKSWILLHLCVKLTIMIKSLITTGIVFPDVRTSHSHNKTKQMTKY